ncbi:hypothetical protein VTH06DRAFT_6094 [Thermothelomyces fergusii]
MPVSTYYRLAS